jgi:hypothetical protein
LGIEYTTNRNVAAKQRESFNRPIKEARSRVANSSALDRKAAVVDLRKVIRKANTLKGERRLKRIRATRTHGAIPMALRVDGDLTCDRSQWLAEAEKFGRSRFGDAFNGAEAQTRRLAALASSSKCYTLDGQLPPTLDLFEVLQGRSLMKDGKAAGNDEVPPEVYKALPFIVVVRICHLFQQRQKQVDIGEPPFWKLIDYIGLPKTSRADSLDLYRWIGKLDCFSKWYLRSLLPSVRARLRPAVLCSFGFKPGLCCDDLVSILRQVLFLASRWGKRVVLGSLDVAVAFDSIDHDMLCTALLKRGLHPQQVCCLLRELSGMMAQISIAGAGSTARFPLERGGKQGGVETPDEFNILVEVILEPLANSWAARGFGFAMDNSVHINHLVWCDNIYIVSSDEKQFEVMAQELTDAIYEYRLSWKPSSLECLRIGMAGGPGLDVQVKTGEGTHISFKNVEMMVVLGTALDARGSTNSSVNHRLAKGDSNLWSNSSAFFGLGSVSSKFKSWCSGPASSASFGACSWHLSKNVLIKIKRWEYQCLRRLFRFKRKPEEGREAFNMRTSKRIYDWSVKFKCRLLHHRVLIAVFQSSWREGVSMSGMPPHLQTLRRTRNRLWWDGVKDESVLTRTHHDMKRAAKGPLTEWEDALVLVFGSSWRNIRNDCANEIEWSSHMPHFVNELCKLWGLPRMANQADARSTVALARIRNEANEANEKSLLTHSDMPASHCDTDVDTYGWHYECHACIFVVDCKPLQEVVCGHSPLKGDSLRPVLRRITNNLAAILAVKWSPPAAWGDPILWRRRDHNIMADFLANWTMNEQRSWVEHLDWPFDAGTYHSCNLVVHSVGGSRTNCSAAAWVVEAAVLLESEWIYRPIARGGTFMTPAVSSFAAESIALECCTAFVKEFVEKHR